eukprot:12416861-Karenia_brevis.AAC.1
MPARQLCHLFQERTAFRRAPTEVFRKRLCHMLKNSCESLHWERSSYQPECRRASKISLCKKLTAVACGDGIGDRE